MDVIKEEYKDGGADKFGEMVGEMKRLIEEHRQDCYESESYAFPVRKKKDHYKRIKNRKHPAYVGFGGVRCLLLFF